MSEVPNDCRFHPEHHWVRVDKTGELTIGITDFAQEALGDVIWAELPEVGSSIRRDEPFAELESAKATSDVFAPVDGEVTVVNEEVADHPEIINEDPYGRGWLVNVRSTADDLSHLLNPSQYKELVAG